MVNMTLAIPEKLHSIMKQHGEIKWSEVARKAIWAHAHKLELMDDLLKESELTEADTITLGKKIKSGMAKKHGIR